MVVLHREMHEPEAVRITPSRTQQCEPNGGKNMLTAQRGKPRAERDMDWLGRAVARTSHVRRVPALRTLAARAPSRATPRERKRERELLLPPTRSASPLSPLCHLEARYRAWNNAVNGCRPYSL